MKRKLSQLRAISYNVTKRNQTEKEMLIKKLGLWEKYLHSKYKSATTFYTYYVQKKYNNCLISKKEFYENENK